MACASASCSLTEFAAAALCLSASFCCAASSPLIDGEEAEAMTTVLSSVLPPLADAIHRMLKQRQMLILHRFRETDLLERAKSEPPNAREGSLHFFDPITLKPVREPKPCRLPKFISDSCYLPHCFGRNKPAMVLATSMKCEASLSYGWAPTIFVLDDDLNYVTPPPSLAAEEAPDAVCSISPHPSERSVVLCASESMHCVMCLDIATAEWYRFGGSSSNLSHFNSMDAIAALPSCGMLAVGSYGGDRIAVCDVNNTTADYETVSCASFSERQSDLCSTSFAPLGEHCFVCMLSWGIGVYDAPAAEQINFFALNHEDKTSCGCGGLVKALEVPHEQKSSTLGLFIVFHRNLLQIVRCDHQLQWSVVNDVDGGPLLRSLRADGFDAEFLAVL